MNKFQIVKEAALTGKFSTTKSALIVAAGVAALELAMNCGAVIALKK